ADGRRTAHNHGDDNLSHLLIGSGEHGALFERELGLIDKANAVFGPGKRRNHAIFSVNGQQESVLIAERVSIGLNSVERGDQLSRSFHSSSSYVHIDFEP